MPTQGLYLKRTNDVGWYEAVTDEGDRYLAKRQWKNLDVTHWEITCPDGKVMHADHLGEVIDLIEACEMSGEIQR